MWEAGSGDDVALCEGRWLREEERAGVEDVVDEDIDDEDLEVNVRAGGSRTFLASMGLISLVTRDPWLPPSSWPGSKILTETERRRSRQTTVCRRRRCRRRILEGESIAPGGTLPGTSHLPGYLPVTGKIGGVSSLGPHCHGFNVAYLPLWYCGHHGAN